MTAPALNRHRIMSAQEPTSWPASQLMNFSAFTLIGQRPGSATAHPASNKDVDTVVYTCDAHDNLTGWSQ